VRSLLSRFSRVENKTPVPYVSTRTTGRSMLGGLFGGRNNMTAQLDAMGGVSTLYAIVDLTSTKVAEVDWKLWRKAKSGLPEDRVEVTSHAALDLLHKPNKFMTQQELFELGQMHQDLTGEGWLVVSRNSRFNLPLELWPVRPDRMEPDPHPTEFLTGYFYNSPDGQKIPLGLNEVIQIRKPHPTDPYRGLGAVQPLLTDLDSARFAGQWNRNFFLNSAEPGGIIEVPESLSDEDFDQMTARWNEQHKGVANAHRVAVIENGKWVNRAFSMRDMQFTELRHLSRDVIMEAFRIHKVMLGITEDVNRASAREGKAIFAEDITVPRLQRWKGALNNDLLPMFGDTTKDLEFDYVSPVPTDEEQENASRESKATAAHTLVDAGYDAKAVLEVVGLPDMPWRERITVTNPVQSDPAPVAPSPEAAWRRAVSGLLTPVLDEAVAPPPEEEPDLTAVQAAYAAALAALLAQWTSVVAGWIAELVEQIKALLSAGDVAGLGTLEVSSATARSIVGDALHRAADDAAHQVVREAAEQDIDLTAVTPDRAEFDVPAQLTVDFLASAVETAAGREAQRLHGPESDAQDVADQVEAFLKEQSDAAARTELGGALHGAINAGRFATFAAGPTGALYATEVMDANTCSDCRAIDGRWICNTDDLAPLYKLYPLTGYVECQGGIRCRGTVTGAWRPEEDR
jgi:HK97 family phage portal protein